MIVPVYNVEQYLPRCLDSLLSQTWKNLELIVVNDGSSDDSWAVMQDYAQRDMRVRIFRKENAGVSAARNFGLERVKGEYIAFVDSDDYVEPQYLEWLYGALERGGTKLSVCDVKSERNDSAQVVFSASLPTEMPEPIIVTLEKFSYQNRHSCVQIWRSLYYRELLETLRFDLSLSIGEDTLFWTQAFLTAGKMAFVEAPLYHYVYRRGSATRQKFSRAKWYSEVIAWTRIIEMTAKYPSMEESARSRKAMACSNVYFHMAKSEYRDDMLKKEMIQTARHCGVAALKVPRRYRKERIKVLLLLFCPELAWKIWQRWKSE